MLLQQLESKLQEECRTENAHILLCAFFWLVWNGNRHQLDCGARHMLHKSMQPSNMKGVKLRIRVEAERNVQTSEPNVLGIVNRRQDGDRDELQLSKRVTEAMLHVKSGLRHFQGWLDAARGK